MAPLLGDRFLAIIPAVFTVDFAATRTFQLLILSQVILSMQLPFAVIPLIRFTGDPERMGTFANALWVKILSWGRGGSDLGSELLAGGDAGGTVDHVRSVACARRASAGCRGHRVA